MLSVNEYVSVDVHYGHKRQSSQLRLAHSILQTGLESLQRSKGALDTGVVAKTERRCG